MPEAFQRFEVGDVFSPERKAVFERPREESPIIIITTPPGDFHLSAEQLSTIAKTLNLEEQP